MCMPGLILTLKENTLTTGSSKISMLLGKVTFGVGMVVKILWKIWVLLVVSHRVSESWVKSFLWKSLSHSGKFTTTNSQNFKRLTSHQINWTSSLMISMVFLNQHKNWQYYCNRAHKSTQAYGTSGEQWKQASTFTFTFLKTSDKAIPCLFINMKETARQKEVWRKSRCLTNCFMAIEKSHGMSCLRSMPKCPKIPRLFWKCWISILTNGKARHTTHNKRSTLHKSSNNTKNFLKQTALHHNNSGKCQKHSIDSRLWRFIEIKMKFCSTVLIPCWCWRRITKQPLCSCDFEWLTKIFIDVGTKKWLFCLMNDIYLFICLVFNWLLFD